jgi:hypothetical protein
MTGMEMLRNIAAFFDNRSFYPQVKCTVLDKINFGRGNPSTMDDFHGSIAMRYFYGILASFWSSLAILCQIEG